MDVKDTLSLMIDFGALIVALIALVVTIIIALNKQK